MSPEMHVVIMLLAIVVLFGGGSALVGSLIRQATPKKDAVSEAECERAVLVAELWGDQVITPYTARVILENFVAQRGKPIHSLPSTLPK